MEKMTEAERQRRIGPYTAPPGYYEQSKAAPFLGRVSCNVQHLVAGSVHEIILDYEVGAAGLADGAWLKATFKFYSDWALFQTSDPSAANYVSAEYRPGPLLPGQEPATVQGLHCRFDQKGHERPFQKAIIIDIVDGYLNPGDHILIRLGDRRFGGPGTRVQSFVEQDFRFRCYVDPVGTSRFAAIPGDVVLQIVPGPAQKLVIATSRLIRPGTPLPLIIRAEDVWGNTLVDHPQEIRLSAWWDQECRAVIPVTLAETGWAVARLTDLPTDKPGELRLLAEPIGSDALQAEAFVTIDAAAPTDRIFYADLHVHSDDTIGTNDTRYNLSYGRDVAGLDILGYTANDFNITAARWNQAVAQCAAINEPGRFVCYPGTEWCGNSCAGGDHNIVFLGDTAPEFPLDRAGNVARSFEWNEEMLGGALTPGAWPLDEVYATYAHDPEGHLLIPHVGGRRCNLSWHHPALERLVEIGSSWGQFPWLLQEALARGYQIGASAASDEHRGRCGGGVPGTAVFGTRGGLTGVIADQLDRASIGRALRARHSFATTGEHLVALAWIDGYRQGDAVPCTGPVTLDYWFLGDAGWEEIAAYDQSGCFWRRDLQAEAGLDARRIRVSWGGARIRDRYRAAIWRGQITVTGATLQGFVPRGLEHPEEKIWQTAENQIRFQTDTFGDTDSVEITLAGLEQAQIRIEGLIDGYVKVGDPLERNPFLPCPDFRWEIAGSSLIAATKLQRELGGADLRLGLELQTLAALPRTIRGRIEIPPGNGPHGFRPIYLAGRQIDDAKAYTSPLFLSFGAGDDMIGGIPPIIRNDR